MAFRIHNNVVKGEIDNTQRGRVTGKIWLAGCEKPILLDLIGNCWRDLAGCRCRFINLNPILEPDYQLAEDQSGEVGDMTASHKVQVPDLPFDEWLDRKEKGLDAPEHWANSIYLEWYSDRNGRVVIESADYQIKVSLPEWEMTDQEQEQQHELNAEAMVRFINRLEAALQSDKVDNIPEEGEMDEFEWESLLKKCDARTERYGELLDKFQDHPDCEKIINEQMGWHKVTESFELESQDDSNIEKQSYDDINELWEEPTPDPELEGIDWVRAECGYIKHPLQLRCVELTAKVFFDAQALGLLNSEDPDLAVAELKFCIQRASAKLAGSLNAFARGEMPPPGFMVANLKRALKWVNDALGSVDQVAKEGKTGGLATAYKKELFSIRTEIIALMNRFRNQSR